MKPETKRYKKIILPIISKYLPNAKVILYGSRARENEGAGSNIDIALDNSNKIDNHSMNKILDDIEESLLPIFYDIVDFNSVSNKLQKEILKDGVVWKN